MEKVLVTGASGFVGTHMVAALAARGYDVTATSRRRPAYLDRPAFRNVRFVAADLHDEAALARALEGVTTVFHIGALFNFFASLDELMRVNAGGTDTLARLARQAGVKRFVNFSSGAIYGTAYGNQLVTELDEPKPGDRYAKSKWAAEQKLFEHHGKDGMLAVSLRLGAIYGPGSAYGDAKALYLLKKGLLFTRPGLTNVRSSHIHVTDAVNAAIHIAAQPGAFREDAKLVSDIAMNVCDDAPTYNADLLRKADAHLPKTWPVPGLGLRLPRMRYLGVPVPGAVLKLFAWLAELLARATGTRPIFEIESIDYITCGHGLANERLRATGYVFLYPSILEALPATIAWYERTGWRVFQDGDTAAALEGAQAQV
jgi:UDP-glucose 4-epimerase